jgi:hypothetical protein
MRGFGGKRGKQKTFGDFTESNVKDGSCVFTEEFTGVLKVMK